MQKVSNVIGKSILSAESGERIGTVSDVLLDPHSQRVVGLVVGGSVLSSERVLPYADVETLGKDAVVARSGKGVIGAREWREQAIEVTRTSALKHRRVLTTGGRALGAIHDLLLDDAGTVESFEISGSALGGLVQRRSILANANGVTVGADAVLVPDEAAVAMEARNSS